MTLKFFSFRFSQQCSCSHKLSSTKPFACFSSVGNSSRRSTLGGLGTVQHYVTLTSTPDLRSTRVVGRFYTWIKNAHGAYMTNTQSAQYCVSPMFVMRGGLQSTLLLIDRKFMQSPKHSISNVVHNYTIPRNLAVSIRSLFHTSKHCWNVAENLAAKWQHSPL